MNFPNGETVTVLTAGTEADPYSGRPSPSWSVTPSAVDVDGCGVEPRVIGTGDNAEQVMDARNAVVSGYTLYLPSGTAITTKNRVAVRGKIYDVIGEPAVWRSPFTGWEPGLVVQLAHTEG